MDIWTYGYINIWIYGYRDIYIYIYGYVFIHGYKEIKYFDWIFGLEVDIEFQMGYLDPGLGPGTRTQD